MLKQQPPPEPQMLVARIESFEQSYYLAENSRYQAAVQDEATIQIVGNIEKISPKLTQHVDQRIDISLVCSRSFTDEEGTIPAGHPFLLSMLLSKKQRSCMAYVPSDAFWSFPRMIDSARVTHIEFRFEPVRYGSGRLLSLCLIPASRLDEL